MSNSLLDSDLLDILNGYGIDVNNITFENNTSITEENSAEVSTERPPAEIEVREVIACYDVEPTFLGQSTEERLTPILNDVNQQTLRFSDAVWFEAIQKSTIMLAGCGGIGSYVAFLLSRMKPERIIMFDGDSVEEVNMAGQLFSYNQIGESKVSSVAGTMSNFSNYGNVTTFNELYTESSGTSDIMICGFDNMEARKIYFNNWLIRVSNTPKENRKNLLFIDGRLAAEKFQILSITGDDEYSIEKYKTDWLFDSSQAVETLCSYKQTTYMANMIASMMVNVYTNFMANLADAPVPREVSFLVEYSGDFMNLNLV